MAARKRFWTLLIRSEGRFLPEFGSFARGEAIAKTSELRLKGVRRSDLKIIASDPDLTSIQKDLEALNDAQDRDACVQKMKAKRQALDHITGVAFLRFIDDSDQLVEQGIICPTAR